MPLPDFPITQRRSAGLLQLLEDPNYRAVGTSLVVAFRTDPDVVAEYVPAPLTLRDPGLLLFWLSERHIFTTRHASERVSPSRSHYYEAILKVPVAFEGDPMYFSVFAWTDSDWLAYSARGSGGPLKMARMEMTQFSPLDELFSGPNPGVRVYGKLDSFDPIARTHADIKRRYDYDELPFDLGATYFPKSVSHRYIPDLVENRPLVNDLCVHWAETADIGDVWGGPAALDLFAAENEELDRFAPRDVIGGYFFSIRRVQGVQRRKVVHRYEA